MLLGYDGVESRYKALYLTLDRAYSAASGWGLNIAYTLQDAEQNGNSSGNNNDLFLFDKLVPQDTGFRPRAGIERHALVISGLLDLPWGFKFSTLTKLGTGQAYQTFDSPTFRPEDNIIGSEFPDKNCLGIFARCEVDVTFEKEFKLFGSHSASFAVDVFNLFNNKNYADFNNFKCCGVDPDVFSFGQPKALLTLPRRFQLRAAYRF
ncbi:MAG: hypothetical protein ABIP07_02440 [Sphingomicrobium sp.]